MVYVYELMLNMCEYVKENIRVEKAATRQICVTISNGYVSARDDN